MHGYSGRWEVEATYEVYRHIQLKDSDYAVFNGNVIPQIPSNGLLRRFHGFLHKQGRGFVRALLVVAQKKRRTPAAIALAA
jgi:hypothetical protein